MSGMYDLECLNLMHNIMETDSSYVIVCLHYLDDLYLLILCIRIPVVNDVNLNDCYKE